MEEEIQESAVFLGSRFNRGQQIQGLCLVACLAVIWLLLPVLHTAGSHELELGGSHCVICQALAHATVLLVGAVLSFLLRPTAGGFPVEPVYALRRGQRFSRFERGPPCQAV